MNPWLTLKDFNVFRSRETDHHPFVQNINISLEGNSSLAIFGPTGSGKSLLLKALMGLQPISGHIHILDYMATAQWDRGELPHLDQLYDQIGFAFQQNGLFDFCSVEENLLLGYTLKSSQEKNYTQYAHDILKHLGLWEHRNKYPFQLSGGQKKRVSIARALTKRPKLLITDDPLAGLDPISSHVVLDLLVDAAKTYNVGLIASISSSAIPQNRFTHCLVLHQGKQLFFGTSHEFQSQWADLSKQFYI